MENTQNNLLSDVDLQIDNQVRQQFAETAKWGKFISLTMFICCGLFLLLAIIGFAALGSILSQLGEKYNSLAGLTGPVIIIAVIIIAAIIAVTYYFLFIFSTKTKTALISENVQELNGGLSALKKFFIISAIISIISLLYNIYQIFK